MTEIILSDNMSVELEEKIEESKSNLVEVLVSSELCSVINTSVSAETVKISQVHFHIVDSTDKNIFLATLYSSDINTTIDRSSCDPIRCENRIIKIALR